MAISKEAAVVSAHAWNRDYSKVAVCENSPNVVIYDCKTTPWKKEHILKLHTMVVTGIDWCPQTDKIVTCSHDVNAFVWTYDPKANQWVPKISILRIDRAAIKCKWSPDGNKFAVASAGKVACVSYYQEANDWWVSKLTQKGLHRSTVLDVAWHPSSQVFATASCDFKCRVFSAFIAEIDTPGPNTVFGDLSSIGFGQIITEFGGQGGGAWVESVAWSPSGNGLAYVCHDSTIDFVSFASGSPVVISLKSASLPYTSVLFLNENVVAAAGHSFMPEIYQQNSGSWQLLGSCDKGSAGGQKKKVGGFTGVKKLFENKVKVGNTTEVASDSIKTTHHNIITELHPCSDGFSTGGLDGRIVVWTKSDIKNSVQGVAL